VNPEVPGGEIYQYRAPAIGDEDLEEDVRLIRIRIPLSDLVLGA
jgi:hypothetical protein